MRWLALVWLLAFAAACGPSDEERAESALADARAQMALGQPAKAIAKLEPARELAPRDPEVRLVLGEAYLALDRTAAAEAELVLAGELAPDSPRVHRGLGKVALRKGQPAAAREAFERASTLDPDDAHTLALWGSVLAELERRDEAVRKLEAAIARDPRQPLALHRLGELLSARPISRERGIRLLERAVAGRASDAGLLHSLGRAYLSAGRNAEALDVLERAARAAGAADPLRARSRSLAREAASRLERKTAPARAPNILLVVIDTLRADHVGSYGYPRATTPRLDALAAGGTLFENAISQAPWTAASVASLFTGLYPSVHGIEGGIRWGSGARGDGLPFAVQRALDPAQQTLAEILRAQGYRTAGFVSNLYVNSIFGFAAGFDTYDEEYADYARDVANRKRRAAETNERVFEWLASPPVEPFFLFVHYNDPHWPYVPPDPYGKEWTRGYSGKITPESTTFVVERGGEPIEGLSDADVEYLVGLYDGEVAYADHHLGALLDRLAGMQLARELLVAVTSDHGEEFLDHGSASHGYTLYDEMIRVPLVLHSPGRVPTRRVAPQVQLIDLLPTLLDLAGIARPMRTIQGQSLTPWLGDGDARARDAFSEATYAGERKALRTREGHKLIAGYEDGPRLYDLSSDPLEQDDLAAQSSEDTEALRERLAIWAHANTLLRNALGVAPPEVELDESLRSRLEALGYVAE